MAGILVAAAACTPNNGVKPGAPELVEFIIGQPAPPGAQPPVMATTVRGDTPDCVSGIATGMTCHPNPQKADIADGGTNDADLPADVLCRDANAMNWCTCDPNASTWNCDAFGNVFAVIAVFDRVLDTTPFDENEAGPIMDSIVTTTASSGAPVVSLSTDYSPTGDGKGLVFNLYGPYFGNLRGDGPSLVSTPQPEFPSGSTITVTLDANQVRAKDHTTPFTGTGLLAGGTVVFTMAPFSASFSPPDKMAMDPNAVTVAYTNFVEPAACPSMDMPPVPCKTAAHLSVVNRSGTPPFPSIPVDISSGGGAYVSVTPTGGAWPAGAMVEIQLDGATTNLLGQQITAPQPLTFTAP